MGGEWCERLFFLPFLFFPFLSIFFFSFSYFLIFYPLLFSNLLYNVLVILTTKQIRFSEKVSILFLKINSICEDKQDKPKGGRGERVGKKKGQ